MANWFQNIIGNIQNSIKDVSNFSNNVKNTVSQNPGYYFSNAYFGDRNNNDTLRKPLAATKEPNPFSDLLENIVQGSEEYPAALGYTLGDLKNEKNSIYNQSLENQINENKKILRSLTESERKNLENIVKEQEKNYGPLGAHAESDEEKMLQGGSIYENANNAYLEALKNIPVPVTSSSGLENHYYDPVKISSYINGFENPLVAEVGYLDPQIVNRLQQILIDRVNNNNLGNNGTVLYEHPRQWSKERLPKKSS